MKTLWFGAAAAAALMTVAAPAAARDWRPLHMLSAAPAPVGGDAAQAQRMGVWGFDRTGMNPSVRPGADFFLHANGGYVDALEIPADRSRFGTFDALHELSVERMRVVLERSAADTAATGDEALIGAFYRSFMDEAAVDALGAQTLAADLAKVRAA
ncbi:MAG: peptidase M13, partial [Phenylobacterium sp.]|nr:peptidase M13 [Phenylobacterium sp.]